MAQCQTVHSAVVASKGRQPLSVIHVEDFHVAAGWNEGDRDPRVHRGDGHADGHSAEHLDAAVVDEGVTAGRGVPQPEPVIGTKGQQAKSVRQEADADHSTTVCSVHYNTTTTTRIYEAFL